MLHNDQQPTGDSPILYVKASSKNPLSVEYVELQGISVATNQPVNGKSQEIDQYNFFTNHINERNYEHD